MKTTVVCVVRPPKPDRELLDRYAATFGHATRWTFSQLYVRRRGAAEIKREAIARLGLHGRIWNGCRAETKAAAEGWRAGLVEERRRVRRRLGVLDARWERDARRPGRKKRNAVARRKAETRLARIEKDLERGIPRVCFGGRGLLRERRVRAWRAARASMVFLPGESGKRAGNEVAQLRGAALRLTLPRALGRGHLVLENIRFGSKHARHLEHTLRERTPVSWRLVLLAKGKVKVCATFDEPDPGCVSSGAVGTLGVDLNAAHCAVIDVGAEGSRGRAHRIGLRPGDEGTRAAVHGIVALAHERACPVVIERLDFRRKKTWLRSHGRRYARMLSSFATRRFDTVLERACRRAGIELRRVDPAWSTKLGRMKYERAARLGPHHAAALVIARRGLGMRETMPRGTPIAPEPAELHGEGTHGFAGVVAQWLPRPWAERSGRGVRERAGSPDERPGRSGPSGDFDAPTTPQAWLPLARRVGLSSPCD